MKPEPSRLIPLKPIENVELFIVLVGICSKYELAALKILALLIELCTGTV